MLARKPTYAIGRSPGQKQPRVRLAPVLLRTHFVSLELLARRYINIV
jgi:hypothetical protein